MESHDSCKLGWGLWGQRPRAELGPRERVPLSLWKNIPDISYLKVKSEASEGRGLPSPEVYEWEAALSRH